VGGVVGGGGRTEGGLIECIDGGFIRFRHSRVVGWVVRLIFSKRGGVGGEQEREIKKEGAGESGEVQSGIGLHLDTCAGRAI